MTTHSAIATFASLKKKPKVLAVIVISLVAIAAFSLAFPKIQKMYRSAQLKEKQQHYGEQAVFIRQIEERIPKGMNRNEAQERLDQKHFNKSQCDQKRYPMNTECYTSEGWYLTILYKNDQVVSVTVTEYMNIPPLFMNIPPLFMNIPPLFT